MEENISSRTTRALFAFGLGIMASACGSGGNGTGNGGVAGIDRGGISSPAIAVGQITGFGSVIVNGVHWNTDSADILIDGAPALESGLEIGQIVRVEGTRTGAASGDAMRVESDDLLAGRIETIDMASGELALLGHIVSVTDQTVFDDDILLRSLEGLAVGQRVAVHGFIKASGRITATYIELEVSANESKVTGFVTNLDIGNFIFEIGGIAVDYSAAARIELPDGAPEEGMLVEVKGNYDSAARTLTAVELDDGGFFDDRSDDYEFEIEGYVTRFVSATDFDVTGIPVTTTSATEFDDGNASDLAEGVRLEVEGRFNSAGVLVATEVELEADDDGAGNDGLSVSDDDYQCPANPVSGASIDADVNVDGVCVLDNVTVAGRIMVQPGSELFVTGSTVGKGLQALSAVSIDIADTSFVENVQITETAQRVALVNVSSEDNIQLEKNKGHVQIEGFLAGNDFQLKESVADVFVSGAAGQNAQIEKTVGGTLTIDVTVGQDAQVKENEISGQSNVQLFGGDQAQCLDNSFDAHAFGFADVDGCIPL